MSNKIQKALEVRTKKQNTSFNSSMDKINAALQIREQKKINNLSSTIRDIQSRYNTEINAFSNATDDKSKTTSRANLAKIKTELEAYRGYINNDEAVDGMISTINLLKGSDKERAAARKIIASSLPSIDASGKSLVESHLRKTTVGSSEYDADYAKEEQLRKEMNEAKAEYEKVSKIGGRGVLTQVIDTVMGLNPTEAYYARDYKKLYEDKKTAYESFKSEFTEKQIQQKHGITGAEYVEQLKSKKKEAETDTEKEFYKNELKKVRTDLYGDTDVFQYIGSAAKTGLVGFGRNIASTMDFILGNPAKLLGFDNNIFTQINNDWKKRLENASEETAQNAMALGDDKQIAGQIATATTQALPDVVFMILSGGSSAVKKIGEMAANPNTINMIGKAIKETFTSPIFYTTFMQEVGINYEEAIESGEANELQASLAALTGATINARLEMGGWQTLPDSAKGVKGFWKKAWNWIKTGGLEEGLEEIEQRVATGVTNKAFYDYDKEIFSFENSDAIINPLEMVKEFGMGTAVGMILGGGTLTINKIANARSEMQLKTIGKAVRRNNNIQDLIDYSKSSKSDSIRAVARESTAKNITDSDIGMLYQKAVFDAKEMFDDVYTEEDLNTVVKEHFTESTPTVIKNIRSAAFANKLIEMNIEPETNELYNSVTQVAKTDNSQSPQSGVLTEAEEKIVSTPDSELTPEQLAVKQSLIEKQRAGVNFKNGGQNLISQKGEAKKVNDNSSIEVLSVRRKNKERRHTTAKEQEFIKKIANALGVKVEFTHITAELLKSYGYDLEGDILPDGFYNKDTKTIHIGFTVYNPVTFIFKHELTHFNEDTELYKKFVEAVRNSKAFKKWLKKRIGLKEDLEDAYIRSIARQRGYKFLEDGKLSEDDRKELFCEMIADFVGDCIFTSDTSMLNNMLSDLSEKERNVVIQHIRDFFSYLIRKLKGEYKLTFEIMQLEKEFNRMLTEAVQTKKETPTDSGGVKFSIVNLDNGKSYVKATRRIIHGNSVAEWRSQISEFFNKALKNGPIEIETIEGDVLTISKDTANKARDKHISENGVSRELTDEEFLVKLHAESHIDELAEISTSKKDIDKNKKIVPDKKNHDMAKDGFSYRTVYFQDFDASYYRITLSVGENNGISTVYNVGKIKADDIPNGNIVSAIGSMADMSSANNRVPQNASTVNNNSMQESRNNSKEKLQFSFARVEDMSLIKEVEELEKKLQAKNKTPAQIRKKIWNKKHIIRDSGGVWVYEIADDEMEFFPKGDALSKDNPDYEEYMALDAMEDWNDEQAERYANIEDKFMRAYGSATLQNYIKHDKLFEKYPQLRNVRFIITDLGPDTNGDYDPETKTIRINEDLVNEAIRKKAESKESLEELFSDYEVRKTIVHEIQHAIQDIDEREPGSSVEFWNRRLLNGERMPVNPKTGKEYTPKEANEFTKGEYEARESRKRLLRGDKAREEVMPDLGWDVTVSSKMPAMVNSLKFSIPTDNEYMEAVESGNTAQAQKMVDKTAEMYGYTERLYHQTEADFTEFNTENQRAGKYDWELPTGTFLKPSAEDIGLKGKKQMELFAKIQNPLKFKDRNNAQSYWRENIPEYDEAANRITEIDTEYREKSDLANDRTRQYLKKWRLENPNTDSREIYKDAEYLRLNDLEDSVVDEWEAKSNEASLTAKKLINDYIAENDYDGIIVEKDSDGANRYTKSYIVFDSSQLKEAAPVTYDNDGKVIPLSERFDGNKKDIRFSIPTVNEVDSYSEEQYNNFGWATYNGVISTSERETLFSRYADYKHNKHKYPTTRFGEAVIHSTECPDVIMYVKGDIGNPQITKVVRIIADSNEDISKINERIIANEYKQKSLPYQTVTAMYGEEYIRLDNRRNNASFREYTAEQKGRNSQESNTVGRSKSDGTGSGKQNNGTDRAGLNKLAFSIPRETDYLLDMYENGEITKKQYREAMDEYWDKFIEKYSDTLLAQQIESARYVNQLKKRIKNQNEQLAKRRSEVSREITEQRESRATKQKNIEHIRKTVNRIDKMLRTNSDKKHVPEELKEEITKFVSVFVENDKSVFDRKDLRNIYLTYSDALRENSAEETNSSLDEDVLNDLKTLRERLDGKTLRDLNFHETLLIRNIVDNFAQVIKWENEMFIAGKQYEMNEIGHTAMSELTAKKSKRESVLGKTVDKDIVYSNMTPIYFFNRIGGVFKTLFNDVVNAQNKWFRNVENSKTFIRQIKEKYHYSEWQDDTFRFTTEKGDEIEITREQAMLLYATARREYGNDFQKAEHLFRGGIVIEPSAQKLKEVVKKFKASDEKGRKRITEAFSEEVDSRAHRITPDDVLKIKFWLTDEQLAYVDAFVEYLSTDMAALGNEISMQLYGIKKYNEDYYIPYNSAQNFLYSQPGVTNEARLKHQSFTKQTVVGANNPLVLTDFSTVCADHINRMCMYNAFTIPLENMNRIFNYKTAAGDDLDVRSIQSEIERVYGKSAVKYIKTFIEDMNGNVRTTQTDKSINRWISRFKKGAVFASASVVVQQPSAIMRAMAYIKPKYFRSTTLKLSERDYQQLVRYASVAGIKEMGRFDTGVGATTTNWLLQETPKGFKNKLKALMDIHDSTYRDDKLSLLAAKADEMTWAHIWAAVKAEVADTTDLKVGSEKYFEACGERFTEVINYTQVYDSTISRSQIMRSKSTGAQMLTAFMSEPTVSLNLLMNAVYEAKKGTKGGKKYAATAVAAFVGNVVLNALLKSLVTAGRDDDEDKTYLEKYIDNFFGNLLSDINPLNMIPFVKDVISVFEGYTVERADMNLFSDLAQSINVLGNDKKTVYEKIESISGSLAAFLGLPVKNVLRDARTVYNISKDVFVNDKEDRAVNSEVKGYMDELADNKFYEALEDKEKEKLEKDISDTVRNVREAKEDTKRFDKFDELYAAKRKGHTAYNKMREQMLEDGYTKDEITEGVKIARVAYMKSIGIDVGEYLLYEIAKSKKYADTDQSDGVTEAEIKAAVKKMDLSDKTQNYFLNQHK